MAGIRTRKRGKTWSYSFEAGNINGKRKVIEKGGFASQDDAFDAGVEAYSAWKHGCIGVTAKKTLLSDFFDQWVHTICPTRVRDSTVHLYDAMVRNHINPHLGRIALQDLTPLMIDRWASHLMQTDNLSYSSAKTTLAILQAGLKYAVYPAGIIRSNPAQYISIPAKAAKKVVKRTIISPERFDSLLESYPPGTDLYIPIMLFYHTGLRLGEALGLRWSNIDFQSETITIDHQLVYVPSLHGYYLRPPKTITSSRTIRIGGELLAELAAWKVMQACNAIIFENNFTYNYLDATDNRVLTGSRQLRSRYPELDFVCTYEAGKFIRPSRVSVLLQREGLNSHSFRHTHATTLIENGAPAKGVAGRLGHASINITEQVYIHNTAALQDRTEKIFEETLRRQKERDVDKA